MNTRGVIGKRIVAVRQRRFYSETVGGMLNEVTEIVLENGTLLRPIAYETATDAIADIITVRPKQSPKET